MWDQFVINPMINALLMLYDLLGNNFVLAISVFTILIRLLTLPLSMRQQRSMQRTQALQPQIQAIQKKYKDNPQKMQEEFQKIGYNPAESLAGCLPLVIQMPILLGLYRAIIFLLGSTPQSLFELTRRVYDSINLTELLPVSNHFMWLNLGQPDPLFILPALVFATMFLQQKLMSPATQQNKKGQEDNPTAAMSQSMQYTMPIMFGFFSMQFQAGLSIYFILSNIIGIMQGLYMRRVLPANSDEKPPGKKAEQSGSKKGPSVASTNGSNEAKKHKARQPTSKRKRRSANR